jgi:predicted GNAT superfamily acetyltransferase
VTLDIMTSTARTTLPGRAAAAGGAGRPAGAATAEATTAEATTAEAAAAEAETAAAEFGVRVTTLSRSADFRRAAGVLQEIWRSTQGEPMSAETLVALDFSGNYVSAAFIGEEMVGVSAAFRTDHGSLHSHISGVLPQAQGRSVGFVIKMHQRAWALERNVTEIGWTFDPLIRRNAHFNLVKLGATVVDYLLDFYGEMVDAFNPGDTSDRLFLSWDLTGGIPGHYADSTGAQALVSVGEDGEPVLHETAAPLLTVALPRDLALVQSYSTGASGRWRLALRHSLSGALADGYAVIGMDVNQAYVLQRKG